MASLRFVRYLAVGIFSVLASAAFAGEKKANSLTEKEVADGWILLFDGETTFGWTGKAEVKDGTLKLVNMESASFSVPLPAGEVVCEVENCRVSAGTGLKILVEVVGPDGPFATVSASRVKTGNRIETVVQDRSTANAKSSKGTIEGPTVSVAWTFTLEGLKNGGGRARSIKFRPADSQRLFNGKDLSGWKVFQDEKRAKSTWEVTAAGELSLKNGPGDLQTEKQFDNFLLQLECKTNGAALNSGVFFRCIADQYQNGYEMQIQNAYKDGDRTKPADFGTGAIYRRIPARKVVSNDQEWFSMTLLAHGPNIATWVNGYPVLNWKDERAPNDNPRQGLRTAKGHLSIQGHDPTTDLLFRNIRIVEVK
jgi:Domain of Unknown Function (DUF1080)